MPDERAAPTDGQVAHSGKIYFVGQGLSLPYEASIWAVSQRINAQMLCWAFQGGLLYFEAEPHSEMVP